jgi:hypothetical protein
MVLNNMTGDQKYSGELVNEIKGFVESKTPLL